jgi:DNA mismatch repair protein MutL
MAREVALLALERHATSKIAEAGDLDRLATFGFRGEALPSIASVSRFSLQTCEAGATGGTEIVVNGGRIVHVRDHGRAQGTRIEVTQLFNSVPARRKFLKTDATEAAHIVAAVRLHALASPHAAFTLIEDGRVVFRSPTCPGLADRVGEIFGRQLAEQLMVIDASEGGMRLHGLIARPGTGGRATRHETITYVNRRPVDSRTLSYGLIESYHEVLPKGRYPAAFVFLEIDPAAVDVNVHPSKREVRFRSEAAVRSFVIRSVLARLREESGGEREAPPPTASTGEERRAEVAVARMVNPALVAPVPPRSAPVAAPFRPVAPVSPPPATPAESPPRSPIVDTNVVTRWRPIGLAHGVYALFETPAGLVLLDRRGAQERIVFEELTAQFSAGAVLTQRLLLPVVLELDPVGSALLRDRLVFLAAHGFEVAEFGRHTFRLEGVPAVLPPMDAEACLRDLLDGFRDGATPERNVEVAREQLARLAAARAVRLPAQAGADELRALVTRLFACRSPHTSPGGRPTHIELSQGELMRRFGKS